jgi:hypothetical protein
MTTLEFFNQYFGRHLVDQTGNAVVDAMRALSSGHKMAKGGPAQRIASGWAVISEGASTLQFKLAATGLQYGDQTRYEAWLDALEAFDGKPIMLIEFDKKPVPVANLFRTHDLRAVQVCSPGGVERFDFSKEPALESGQAHRNIWKLKLQRLKNALETTASAGAGQAT